MWLNKIQNKITFYYLIMGTCNFLHRKYGWADGFYGISEESKSFLQKMSIRVVYEYSFNLHNQFFYCWLF